MKGRPASCAPSGNRRFLIQIHQHVSTLYHDIVAVQLDIGIVVQLALLHAEFPGVPGADNAAIDEVSLAQRASTVRA